MDRNRHMATHTTTPAPVPAPRRESVLASDYPTAPLPAETAQALDRLHRRIFGTREVA